MISVTNLMFFILIIFALQQGQNMLAVALFLVLAMTFGMQNLFFVAIMALLVILAYQYDQMLLSLLVLLIGALYLSSAPGKSGGAEESYSPGLEDLYKLYGG